MSQSRFQSWLLRNTSGLQYLVNERLATRGGAIGRFFKAIEMGPRQYGQHALYRSFRVFNYFYVMTYQILAVQRPVFSRFFGVTNGPLNYSGVALYLMITLMILGKFRFIRDRDVLTFNRQDNPEFWYSRYNMMFPPSFLHNRISAHYIEINHIFGVEMLRKYQAARQEILAERDTHDDRTKRTKYCSNPNYVYEPLQPDTNGKIQRLKDEGVF